MNNTLTQSTGTADFNEDQWLNALFLISDTQTWLNEIHAGLICKLPIKNRKKLLRKTHFLSPTVLAHILERHYYKIHRHPNAAKFTISIPAIVSCIRNATEQSSTTIPNSANLQRVLDTGEFIGISREGWYTKIITVISDTGGTIITAFPGTLKL